MGVGTRRAFVVGGLLLAACLVAVLVQAGRNPAPAAAACEPVGTSSGPSPTLVPGPGGAIVLDDFDGTSLRTDLWCPMYYWDGVEYGLDDRGEINLAEQVSVQESMLDIHAQRATTPDPNRLGDRGADRPYRSGVVTTGMTQDAGGAARLSWQYGLLEVRAKIPVGRGYQDGYWTPEQSKMWPAIWMLAADGTVNDTSSPEIDLIDVFGDSTYVQFSLQNGRLTPGAYGGAWKPERVDSPEPVLRYSGAEHWDPIDGPFPVWPPRVEYGGAWHTWGLSWTPDRVEFLVDGVVHGTDTTNVPAKPYYLLLNLAVGHRDGFWPPGDETPDDEHLYVDWVRLTPHADTRIWRNGVLAYGG